MKQVVLCKCDHRRIFVNIWNLASCTGSIYIQAEFALEITSILYYLRCIIYGSYVLVYSGSIGKQHKCRQTENTMICDALHCNLCSDDYLRLHGADS